MSYWMTLGLESWQSRYALPGAKREIAASAMQFFDQGGPVLNVIYAHHQSQLVESLLHQFWQAIERVGNCRSQPVSLSSLNRSADALILILGDDLARSISDTVQLASSLQDKVYRSEDPQAVIATPAHKAVWWKLVIELLSSSR